LHICCGPCLIYPFGKLKEKGFNIRGYYYNPNLYPQDEYLRRVEALQLLCREFSLEVAYPGHNPEDFSRTVKSLEDPLAKQRCVLCWSLRLRKTAQAAREAGVKTFSTTLLVSPYQDHDALRRLGTQIARETGVDFYYEDFRPGFKWAQQEAKDKGIYRQKYCGCEYSMVKTKPAAPVQAKK